MQILEVNIKSTYYKQGVVLRKLLFFDGYSNADELINDKFEAFATHIIVLNTNRKVIGTGRLNFLDRKAVISQMTVDTSNQKSGIGSLILKKLIKISYSQEKISEIQLNARVTAIPFYEKHGFRVTGELFSSKKTGVLHQLMVLK